MKINSKLENPRFALIVLVIFLNGCATMNQTDCELANWYEIGFDEGEHGHNRNRLGAHFKACREFGIRPDREEYIRGWEHGIIEYCSRDRGFREGISGANYANSCPSHLEDRFLVAYQVGERLYSARSRVDEIREDIDDVDDDLDKDSLSTNERRALRDKRKRLRRDLDYAKNDLFSAELNASSMGFPSY